MKLPKIKYLFHFEQQLPKMLMRFATVNIKDRTKSGGDNEQNLFHISWFATPIVNAIFSSIRP
jgi:hypothetical protein